MLGLKCWICNQHFKKVNILFRIILHDTRPTINPFYKMYQLRQPPLDLFGEVAVTESDIFDWVAAVAPRWLTPERSFKLYVKNYDVASKVRAAKLQGHFEKTIDNHPRQWHPRLGLDIINAQ